MEKKVTRVNPLRVGVVTVPIGKSGIYPLSNLMNILFHNSEKLFLFTGNNGYSFFKSDPRFMVDGKIYPKKGQSPVSRILHYIWIQISTTLYVLRRRNDVDIWIFFFGGYRLHLPIFFSKLLGKKVILLLADSGGRHLWYERGIVTAPPKMMIDFPYAYADYIVLYSPYLITEFHLEPFREKILFAHEHFINFGQFKITSSLRNRSPIIGFIGRISEEKGVKNFVRALRHIHAVCGDVQFFIGGDGPQIDEVKSLIKEENLEGLVELSGWIAHDNLPAYLNQFRLLVVPSYTEGLPNIVLEAMACGTPVLATPVGGIPDIIEDGKTGFLMETNSPECIAKNVVRALRSPDLERTADTAWQFIQNNYSFDQTSRQWKSIIHNFR